MNFVLQNFVLQNFVLQIVAIIFVRQIFAYFCSFVYCRFAGTYGGFALFLCSWGNPRQILVFLRLYTVLSSQIVIFLS